MRNVLGWIIGPIAIVLVYAVLNGLLAGGQYLWHHKEHKQRDQIKTLLDHERPQIQAMERELQTLTERLSESEARRNSLGAEIEQIEASHPFGIPEYIYTTYSTSVDRYNSLVEDHNREVTRQQMLYDRYSSAVDQYNSLVVEANALAKQAGGTWLVVPVPRLGTRAPVRAR